ncbi:hypothetical protein D3C73_270760 [compost metagenome]
MAYHIINGCARRIWEAAITLLFGRGLVLHQKGLNKSIDFKRGDSRGKQLSDLLVTCGENPPRLPHPLDFFL